MGYIPCSPPCAKARPPPVSSAQRNCPCTQHKRPPVTPPCALPVTPPCARPVTPPCARPVTPPCARPVTAPCARSVTPPCARPVTPPCARPVTPPCARSVTPPCARPLTPPCARPVTPPCARPVTPPCARLVTPPCARPVTPACTCSSVIPRTLTCDVRTCQSFRSALLQHCIRAICHKVVTENMANMRSGIETPLEQDVDEATSDELSRQRRPPNDEVLEALDVLAAVVEGNSGDKEYLSSTRSSMNARRALSILAATVNGSPTDAQNIANQFKRRRSNSKDFDNLRSSLQSSSENRRSYQSHDISVTSKDYNATGMHIVDDEFNGNQEQGKRPSESSREFRTDRSSSLRSSSRTPTMRSGSRGPSLRSRGESRSPVRESQADRSSSRYRTLPSGRVMSVINEDEYPKSQERGEFQYGTNGEFYEDIRQSKTTAIKTEPFFNENSVVGEGEESRDVKAFYDQPVRRQSVKSEGEVIRDQYDDPEGQEVRRSHDEVSRALFVLRKSIENSVMNENVSRSSRSASYSMQTQADRDVPSEPSADMGTVSGYADAETRPRGMSGRRSSRRSTAKERDALDVVTCACGNTEEPLAAASFPGFSGEAPRASQGIHRRQASASDSGFSEDTRRSSSRGRRSTAEERRNSSLLQSDGNGESLAEPDGEECCCRPKRRPSREEKRALSVVAASVLGLPLSQVDPKKRRASAQSQETEISIPTPASEESSDEEDSKTTFACCCENTSPSCPPCRRCHQCPCCNTYHQPCLHHLPFCLVSPCAGGGCAPCEEDFGDSWSQNGPACKCTNTYMERPAGDKWETKSSSPPQPLPCDCAAWFRLRACQSAARRRDRLRSRSCGVAAEAARRAVAAVVTANAAMCCDKQGRCSSPDVYCCNRRVCCGG